MPMSERAVAEAKELIGVLEGKRAKYQALSDALGLIEADKVDTLESKDGDPEEIKTLKKRLRKCVDIDNKQNQSKDEMSKESESRENLAKSSLNEDGQKLLDELQEKCTKVTKAIDNINTYAEAVIAANNGGGAAAEELKNKKAIAEAALATLQTYRKLHTAVGEFFKLILEAVAYIATMKFIFPGQIGPKVTGTREEQTQELAEGVQKIKPFVTQFVKEKDGVTFNADNSTTYEAASESATKEDGGVHEILVEGSEEIFAKKAGENAIDPKNPKTYIQVTQEDAYKTESREVADEKAARTPIEQRFNYSSARVAGRLFSDVSEYDSKKKGEEPAPNA